MDSKTDTNHDTVVSFFELEKYVEEGVKSWSMKKGKNQKPYTKIHEDKHGDLILSYASNPDKSLVDQRLPKTLVGFDYAFRSAILPGWGQWYGEHKYKAGGYFIATAVLLANFAQKRNVFKAEQKEFNSIPLVPYNWNENALFINQINVSNGKRNLLNAENNFFIAGYALGAIWGINILDAYIFKTATKNPLAIHFNTKIDPVTFRREASIQGINPVLYSIEFQMKF